MPKKFKYSIILALIIPILGRLNLSGTGGETEYFRLIVPFFVGGLSGFFIGLMHDRFLNLVKNMENIIKVKTSELENNLKLLKTTQAQLVQSEKMSSLGQLVAGIAHEINNPINYITNSMSNIKETSNELKHIICEITPQNEEGEKCREIFYPLFQNIESDSEVIKRGSKRIYNLVQSLKNFARHDESLIKNVNLNDGINSTLVLLKQKTKEIEIIKNFGDIPSISCKASEINQVIMNILSNAVNAINTDKLNTDTDSAQMDNLKKPTISIYSGIKNNMIILEFENNGPMIPKEVQPRIFDPFFTTNDVGKGTGLGLAISYMIIKEHCGEIHFKTGDFGTKFFIELPVACCIKS